MISLGQWQTGASFGVPLGRGPFWGLSWAGVPFGVPLGRAGARLGRRAVENWPEESCPGDVFGAL